MNLAALLPAAKAATNAISTTNPATVNTPVAAAPIAQQPASTNPASMSFDPQYEATKNTINQGLAGLQSSKDLNILRTNQDYTTNKESAAKANTQNLSDLQNRLANQGIGYSGVNVAEQGRIGVDYGTQLANLATGNARSLDDIERDFADKQSAYKNQSAQNEIDRGARETVRQTTAAADEAAAAAAKTTADLNRQWLNDITATLTKSVQPTATPTGQMALPPTNSQAVVQQALKAVPPPAAKTPQQQAAEAGIDTKQLQTLLGQRGFNPGPVDGVMGLKTQTALARWKQSIGLPATADITPEIWQQLVSSGVGNQSTGNIAMASAGPARRAL